jgi:hypothetical protein
MLEPPEKVKSNEAWLQKWKPPVKRDIDWGNLKGSIIGSPACRSKDENLDEFSDGHREYQEPEFLTIGLIGMSIIALTSRSYPNNPTVGIRPTECRQIFFIECSIRCTQGPGIQNPWKGQS